MSTPDDIWSVVVHGGARSIPPSERALFASGAHVATRAAAAILMTGGSALDAVEAAVKILEDLPQFNAGHGSVSNAGGFVEMDAAIMDGATLDVGGVGALRDIRHPIGVARAMLRETPTLLVGDGAAAFASKINAEPALREDAPAAPGDGCDTVGCVARDRAGNLAAAGSTGGLEGAHVGRIGDTPLPGCGLYADNSLGAAALSGEGESISRGALAINALHALSAGSPQVACAVAIERLATRIGGEVGVILIAPDGKMGIAHNSAQFSLGIAASWIDGVHAGTSVEDLKEWLA